MNPSNVETLRVGYDALNDGDLDKVLEVIDPEIVWEEGDASPEAGSHRGRDSFESFFRSWIASFEDFRIQPLEIIERGDTLIAVVRQSGRGKASGIAVEVEIAHTWEIHQGRAIRWQAFRSRGDALKALSRDD